jgi:hypothetical protein
MNLVLDQLKGVMSDSVAKFLKENIKLEDTDIKTIFGDNMDKVLYHDEGFVKELSSKMSDVVMPAYMKELRYLKKVVSGIDDVSKDLKELQDKLEKELKAIKPNPQNAEDTMKQVNTIVEQFVKKANDIAKNKIGLREVQADEGTQAQVQGTQAQVQGTQSNETLSNIINPTINASSLTNPAGVLPAGVLPAGVLPAGPALTNPSAVSNALTNEISNMIQNANKKSGGAPKHLLDVEPNIDTYLENYQKKPRIPKRNYNEYDGNVSQLINQIVREKIANFDEKSGLTQDILNSQSYKDAIESMNKLFIAKPDIKAEAINNLILIIKESKMPNTVLQKILNKTTAQIKASSGGTRKKHK